MTELQPKLFPYFVRWPYRSAMKNVTPENSARQTCKAQKDQIFVIRLTTYRAQAHACQGKQRQALVDDAYIIT